MLPLFDPEQIEYKLIMSEDACIIKFKNMSTPFIVKGNKYVKLVGNYTYEWEVLRNPFNDHIDKVSLFATDLEGRKQLISFCTESMWKTIKPSTDLQLLLDTGLPHKIRFVHDDDDADR